MRTLAYTPRYCAACTKNRSAVVCQHVFSQDAPASDLADFDQHRCDDAPDDGNRRAVCNACARPWPAREGFVTSYVRDEHFLT